MLGVFKRRWKPKRVPSDAIRPAGIGVGAGTEGRCVSPVGAQVHPIPVEPNQLHAYEPAPKRKQQMQLQQQQLQMQQQQQQQLQQQQSQVSAPTHANICVQGGRIEFVKQPQDGAALTPDIEKFDGDKEALEERIRQLEQRLEAEASNAQRDRLAVARLQHQLSKREEGVCRDVDQVSRDELHARLVRAEHEAERANARLRAAHRELSRMEETVRSLLQYKNCVETLKQEKSSLSAVLEARSIHYQNSLQKLSSENEALKAQLATLQATNTPNDNPPQYERCLDEVAAQVVRALLTQKGLLDEVGRLNARTRDLEAQNRTLGTLLLRQLKPKPVPSPATPSTPGGVQTETSPSPKTSESQCKRNSLLSFDTICATVPSYVQLKSYSNNISARRRSHKDNRISKSNNDISSSLSAVNNSDPKNDCNKRRSDGDIKLPSSTTNLYSEHSIISFKDEPFSDMMSVCVSHHTYQLSAEDKRRHQILADLWTELKSIEVTPQSLIEALQSVDPSLWAPPERPLTLNLKKSAPVMLSQYLHRLSQTIPDSSEQALLEDETVLESPESGNRDEGYSTMSSDVQIDPLRQGSETNRELEDLKEASDETENQVLLSINNIDNTEDKTESEILYIPLNIAFNLNQRNSFPPSKNIFPFQHIIRSFSDSHLCLRLTASQYIENCFTLSSPLSSTPSNQNIKILTKDKRKKLLKRANGTSNLLPSSKLSFDKPFEQINQNRNSWTSNIDDQVDGCEYDADYVQHWLKLDDTRSSLQQQHRDLLEYDQAELEDWSLNLSCEELDDDNWKKNSFNDMMTPGQLSVSTLPSIQENNALELEEDVSECLWNNSSYMVENINGNYNLLLDENESDSLKRSSNWPYSIAGNADLLSPIGSWSSIENSEDCSECFYNKHLSTENDVSKRSSGYVEEPESSSIGIDFTRDFYRLVKFESTKSLASNSSKCLPTNGSENSVSTTKSSDIQSSAKNGREQVLQNVLNYIAEQQKYCFTREELDSLPPSRPTSEIHELPPPFSDSDYQVSNQTNGLKNMHDFSSNHNEIGSSENDTCDIVIRNELSLLSNASSDLDANFQICERKMNLTCDNNLCDNFLNVDDADKLYMLQVSHKNEINKGSDLELGGNSRIKTELMRKPVCSKKTIHDTSHGCALLNGEGGFKTHDGYLGCPKDIHHERKKKSLTKPSMFDNVIKLSLKDSEPLITVVEEEESSLENSSIQMSDSMTTSISTTDTVATEIRTDKKKYDKSKIPIPIQSYAKKHSQIPKLSKKTVNDHKLNVECSQTSSLTGNIIITNGSSPSKTVSFHESATSKDVIDHLNRMIRKGEDNVGSSEIINDTPCIYHTSDKALWKPSGWVHVEKEIDFNDPKARANLLDVMLASSDSSPSSTSSCAGSFSSESSDDKADYSKLHQLHRYRRQRKAAALRERGLAVLRFSYFHRPSIIGRDNFFVRYGKQEQDAVSCFDFLEDISRENEHPESSEEIAKK